MLPVLCGFSPTVMHARLICGCKWLSGSPCHPCDGPAISLRCTPHPVIAVIGSRRLRMLLDKWLQTKKKQMDGKVFVNKKHGVSTLSVKNCNSYFVSVT